MSTTAEILTLPESIQSPSAGSQVFEKAPTSDLEDIDNLQIKPRNGDNDEENVDTGGGGVRDDKEENTNTGYPSRDDSDVSREHPSENKRKSDLVDTLVNVVSTVLLHTFVCAPLLLSSLLTSGNRTLGD